MKSVTLDFGWHLTGYFTFHTKTLNRCQDAPVRIKFTFGEAPAELNTPLDPWQGTLSRAWMQDETVTIEEMDKPKTIARGMAFRYLKIELLGASPDFDFAIDDLQFKAVSSAGEAGSATGGRRAELSRRRLYLQPTQARSIRVDLLRLARRTRREHSDAGRCALCPQPDDGTCPSAWARQYLEDYWGGMVKKGADTFWEAYDPNDDLPPPNYSIPEYNLNLSVAAAQTTFNRFLRGKGLKISIEIRKSTASLLFSRERDGRNYF